MPKDMQKIVNRQAAMHKAEREREKMLKNEANRADDTSIKSWLFFHFIFISYQYVCYNKSAKSSLHFIFTSWCANIQ